MDRKVLLEALARPWFMEPQSAAYYASIVHRILAGENVASLFESEEQAPEFAFIVNGAGKRIGGIEEASQNGVAVINLRGAVMKYDYCGAPGTQTLMKALDAANQNPAVSSIVLQIDSPGGSVDGTQQFANAVKSSKKPVVAYINGMMASAAMWIGSAASQRIASSNTDVIGSIGTMASWNDYKGYYESKGIKTHEVYATDSTHKNIGFREAQSGNYDPLIKGTLDPMNNQFTGAVKANLPGVDPVVFNGSHYIASEAKAKGLVDKIGTFESAVKAAMQLAKDKQNKYSNKMVAFQNTLAASQSESFEVIDGGFLLSEEQLNNIEAQLVQNEEIVPRIAAERDEQALAAQQATEQLTAAQETINTQAATIADLEAQVATLKAAPAGSFSETSQEADEIGAAKPVAYETSFDREAREMKKRLS